MITTDSTFSQDEVIVLKGYRNDIFEIINSTKEYIMQNDCSLLKLDISSLNMVDSVKLAVLCSTYHFSKYPTGKITWIVRDEMTRKQIEFLKLDNVEVNLKKIKHNYVSCDKSFNQFLRLCK